MPTALACIVCLLIPGSSALSQPFPSFMLDSTIVRGPSSNAIAYTCAAFGPTVGLVVWVENSTLMAVRVDTNGTLLDSTPIDVNGPRPTEIVNMRPGVAWGGHLFLVVWNTETTGADDCAEYALVAEDGSVVARHVLQENVNAPQGNRAVAAFDGENFLAAWLGYDYNVYMPAAFFARISPEAVMLDSPPRRVAPGATIEQNELALCFHGDRYLAVWTVWDTSGVWGSFVLPDGSTPDSAGFPIKRGIRSDYPSVTHDRQNFIVGWYEDDRKTRLARVTDDGTVLDSGGVLIDSASSWDNAVFSTGDATILVDMRDSVFGWDSLTPTVVRVDTALRLLDSMPIPLSWPSDGHNSYAPRNPSVCLSGSNYFVSWHQPFRVGSLTTNPAALYRRLNRQGQFVDTTPMLANLGANVQRDPRMASDGDGFLAAWEDTRFDSAGLVRSVYAARFTVGGSPQTPIYLGPGTAHDVTYGGGCYLVVWNHDSSALAARLSPAGALLDSLPIMLSGPERVARRPVAAYGDSVFLVAWEAASDSHIHGIRLSPSGNLLDSTPRLLQRNESCLSRYPRIAFDGLNFLVVRNDGLPAPRTFRGVRVNTAGQIVDTDDISIGSPNTIRDEPELAFGGGVYLMTSTDRYVSWRISTTGEVLDSLYRYGAYQAGFDGSNFVLVCNTGSADLGAVRVTPDGLLLDSTPIPIAALTVSMPQRIPLRWQRTGPASADSSFTATSKHRGSPIEPAASHSQSSASARSETQRLRQRSASCRTRRHGWSRCPST